MCCPVSFEIKIPILKLIHSFETCCGNYFKFSSSKRSHHMTNGAEDGSQSTGLTQEIDILDIGSSTPKRKKSKSPLKGVLKIRWN